MSHTLKTATVLVVDDALDSIEIVNQILQDDYRVLFALCGVMGLSIAQQQKPDIILLDVSMPDMDGYQVCRELKTNPDTRDIPVIFVTGKNEDEDQEMGFHLGGADYLTKPVRPATVKVRVKNQLQLRQNEALIMQQALYDNLTHLPNRNLIQDRLRYMIAKDKRESLKTALLFIDLDDFKTINDTLGHDVGDQLLVEAAKRLRRCVREADMVGRLGGDEFVVILAELKQIDSAIKVAETILATFSRPIVISDMEMVITASIGIAVSPDDGDNDKRLLSNADAAMYQSKHAGRNNYHLFNEAMNLNIKRRMVMEHHLRHALERNELKVHYQAIVDVKTHTVLGAEALLRWHSPKLGKVAPDEFIGLAEQSGLIESIGEFVLHQSCVYFQELNQKLTQPLLLAVNISPQQFRRGYFPQLVSDILKETGFNPRQLELEVTEGLLLAPQSNIKTALQDLRDLGIRLSMDDFGTGYSSLSYLRNFPFDTLKIDRSFIMELEQKPEDQALVTAIIAMAHALGLKVVAEGVENRAQLNLLATKQCDMVQGFLFSRPEPQISLKKQSGI